MPIQIDDTKPYSNIPLADPEKFTNFNCTDCELEHKLIFAIAVAGKKALTTDKILRKFLVMTHAAKPHNKLFSPFESIRKFSQEKLHELVVKAGFGCHELKAKGFYQASNSDLDFRTCSLEELEKIPGIGYKTSRFFALHTRRNCGVACLDRHVLKFLREMGYSAPKATPQSKKNYKRLEVSFLDICKGINVNPAEFDLFLWNYYRVNQSFFDKVEA